MFTGQKSSIAETFLLFIALSCLLCWIALNRFIAADEGFYLLASKLVIGEKEPYLDFFYPQMPGLPYLYGAWLALFGSTWESARIFAALLSAGSGILLYRILLQQANRVIALFGLLALLCTGLYIGWYPLAKTYSASTLALLLAFVFFQRDATAKGSYLFWCGLFVGLSVNIRLFYVVAIPAFLLFILFEERFKEKRFNAALWFLLGGFVTFLPHLYLMLIDFDSYWFNNVGYHIGRSHRSPAIDALSRAKLTRILFGLQLDPRVDGYQFPVLLYGTVLSFFWALYTKHRAQLCLSILALALFVIQFLPDPIHYQYFSTIVPFMILAVLLFIHSLLQRRGIAAKGVATLFILLILSQSVLHAPRAYRRFTVTGKGVKGISKQNKERTRLETAKRISDAINGTTQPGETVLTLWPGYLFESHAKILPGLENQFWLRISHKLSENERERYHLVSEESLREALKDPTVKALVAPRHKIARYFKGIDLQALNMRRIDEISGIRIYRRD